MLGWDSASASQVEDARARLKRLVEQGWPVEEKPGIWCRAARRWLMSVDIDQRMTASLVPVRRS
ncbi:hypothetical protein [Streptomyces sp. NPDC048419]|uniref:hypothetical protein n=1 Tax=Streptomyces sp. NPDC048419 TaxID=3365547 RepID=UPI003714E24B